MFEVEINKEKQQKAHDLRLADDLSTTFVIEILVT